MRIGVLTFPGSLDDVDAARAVRLAGGEPVALWHADHDLKDVDAVVLPGGFSYGDYLRAGAIAARAPLMQDVVDARAPGPAGAGHLQRLPGALRGRPAARRADPQQPPALPQPRPGAARRARRHRLDAATTPTASASSSRSRTARAATWRADEDLDRLEGEGRVVVRYVEGNPNGLSRDIAGVTSENGRVVGLMPHPEHAVEDLTGPSTDGLGFFTSVLKAVVNA